jgi:Mg2+ and Co2+ transporter CorA
MIDPDMLNPLSIKRSLEELATRLQRSGDSDAAARLSSLAVAVEKRGATARQWVSTDIYKIIDPDSIVEGYRSRRISAPGCILEMMEVLRNTLIFLPIVVTWYGVSQATAMYSQLLSEELKAHPQQVEQPFLYLWQQSFGGRLPGWLTLSSVALTDAIILVIILLLTLLVHSFSNASQLQEERHAQKLHADLVHAIARASLLLQDRSPQAAPAGDLQQIAQNIDNMANQITVSFQRLGNDMMTRFDSTVNGITSQLTTITNNMNAQLQAGGQYLQQLGSAAWAVNRLAQDIGDTAHRLETVNKDLRQSLDALLAPAADLANQQKSLLDAVNQSMTHLQGNAQLLQTNATTLEDIAKQQGRWSSDFTDALDTLSIATHKVEDLMAKFGGLIGQQSAFLDQLGDERDAQAKLADNMTQATLGMQDALQSVHAISGEMRRIAVDTNDLLRLYASLPMTVRTDMANIVNGYINAAHVISKGGSDLSDAATSIFTVVQELERVINELEKRLATI